jgi:hypothetical protein
MALILPNASEVTFLQFALGASVPGNQLLKLFTNNVIPGDADTAATYTEMVTQGYVAKTLTKASWSVVTSSSVGTGTYAAQTWAFDGTGGVTTVYGYFIVDATSGLLLWSESFVSAKAIQYAGDQITLTPTITLSKV